MKFIVDENIAPGVVGVLRSEGYDVLYVAEQLKSFDDASILKISLQEKRILITKDKDFGVFVFKKRFSHSGVMLLRLTNDSDHSTLKALKEVLKIPRPDLENSFVVVDDFKVRVVPPRG